MLTAVVGCFVADSGRSEFQPPEITIVESMRSVAADVEWQDPTMGPLTDEAEHVFTEGGPWHSKAVASGNSVDAEASQKSDITKFSIHGEASVSANSLDMESASAASKVQIKLTVPVDAPFSVSAKFDFPEFSGYDGPIYLAAFAFLGPVGGECGGITFIDPADDTTWDQECIGTAPANSEWNFVVSLETRHDTVEAGQSSASVEFILDFGDRDYDGLLDVWEEDGISIEGGGFIDLPTMGADPDRKDIFVELDVMDGVLYEPEAIERVIDAFAKAPASLVNNYDGSPGIQLHVVLDGDRPEYSSLTSTADTHFPPEFHAIKTQYFGSETERVHPNWPEIWDARLHVFRYALWGPAIDEPESCSGGLLGISGGIPSMDFIIAASKLHEIYFSPLVTWTADDLLNAYAGTFMHELGHTLGLRHGGGSEHGPHFKPNYLSIMNYAYSVPWPKQTSQQTHAREAWRLDFSRQALSALDEARLNESNGLDGPAGRKILFNSAPNDFSDARITIGWASAPVLNWNHDFDQDAQPIIETEPLDPAVDISRFSFHRSESCGHAEIPSSLDVLSSYSDWDRLQYGLAGVTQAAGAALLPGAVPSERGLDVDTFFSVLAAEWVDQTVDGSVIFADGFESANE